jgi:ABC-type antimicrobial peptide transport system permease subunit
VEAARQSRFNGDRSIVGRPVRMNGRPWITSAFGGLGVLLAAVGLYGTIAFHVSRRTQEIGIRLALGARAADVRQVVVREAARMASVGIVLGIVIAAVLASLLRTLLVGVSPFDPLTYGVVALALGAVCVAAAFIPALRATNVNPIVALRSE